MVCWRRDSCNTPLLDPRLVSMRGVVGVALHKHLIFGVRKCAECIHTEEYLVDGDAEGAV